MYSMTRREFIRNNLLFGSMLYGGGMTFNTNSADGSKIIVAKNDAVRIKAFTYDRRIISSLLDKTMKNLYGTDNALDAWEMVANPSDVVGLKVNCLSGRRMSTSLELTDVIIKNLKKAGVKKKNIIIWDRMNIDLERAGYEIKTRGSGVKCFGNDAAGFESDLSIYGEIGSLLSRTLTEYCSVIIDVPVLKDHGIVGVTISLKNFFGAIHNPNKYHEKLGNPYIADLWLAPVIRQKTKLIICDALTAQYEGGPPYKPQWVWEFNGILSGRDPVALDYVGWDIIERKRKEMGLKSLKDSNREPVYIRTAGDKDHR
ncbi:DUF362 domain-containing protein, partial [bacterium]|nr:DUF362 domain-containing protein [bacterium]